MSQEMFPGRVTPMAAAGFVGLMSLFQHGRTFVLGLNVCLHRPQETYFCFFILGTMLYATVPCTGEIGSISLFVLCFLVIIRMYGGGFSKRCHHTSCSARATLVQSMGCSSPLGQWPTFSVLCWSITFVNTTSRTVFQRRRPRTPRCTLWPGCLSWASSVTCMSVRFTSAPSHAIGKPQVRRHNRRPSLGSTRRWHHGTTTGAGLGVCWHTAGLGGAADVEQRA
jgi:hypothetical protein